MSLPGESTGGLVVRGLRKRIDDFLLEADFHVGPGERAALIGRSGSGKTTLLRLLAGLEPADAGEIWLGSLNLAKLPPRERGIGLVFQDQALFPSMSVVENVLFPLELRKIPRAEAREEALLWLERVGLSKFRDAPVTHLSGGERQRVAFARALIWKPRLLLLDEPFSALDRELRSTLCRELVKLHELWPVPMLLVSHDELDLQAVATVRLQLRASGAPSHPSGAGTGLVHSVQRLDHV